MDDRDNDHIAAACRAATARWKRITAAICVVCIALAIGLVWKGASNRLVDDRLLGTWQSDRERTMEGFKRGRSLTEKQEAMFANMLGKLKITYSRTTFTTELDGVVETQRYEVLGKDERTVVLRELDRKPPQDIFPAFSLIEFDGPDSYCVQTGNFREYFKRVE
jgi:hypothetical protein